MGAKRQKRVEYTETEVFDLFPKIEYTRFQRLRFVLFHCYANNIVRFIRYAKNFDELNRICLIYVVGQPKPEKIMKELESSECSDRMCVLCSDFPLEEKNFYDEFHSWRKQMKSYGMWDEEQNKPNEKWYSDVEKHRRQRNESGIRIVLGSTESCSQPIR